MSRQEILDAIPHRDPFLLIDDIVEQTDSHIVGVKRFSGEEYFFAGHYPSFPIVPGVLLCEAAMQCGAVLLSRIVSVAEGKAAAEGKTAEGKATGDKAADGKAAGGKVPVATRMNDVRFKRIVRPGDTIRIEVDLTERLADAFFLKAKVTVGDKVAVRFEFACTLANPTAT
jgi:3-hydroxyacyl-[acyl-carrier-protein] dehydratase